MEPVDGTPQELTRPLAADAVLGDRADLMERYVAHLADTGVSHGLIGPRERPRLWGRHILNCVAVQELIPDASRVVDVGSGAGLPGLVLAIARPDLQVTLVEPLLRRVTWLESVLEDLPVDNVRVRRARAEQVWDEVEADVVTSRAVARLEDLARWSLPLLRPGGTMLALKGSSAPDELARAHDELRRLGVGRSDIVECGGGESPPTTVVRIELEGPAVRSRPEKRQTHRPSGARRRGGRSSRRRQSRSR